MTTDASTLWRCLVCGYIHHGPTAPECCPVCGAGTGDFTPHVEQRDAIPTDAPGRWRCLNCGYTHVGAEAPGLCPVCQVARDRFEYITNQPQTDNERNFSGSLVVIGAGVAGLSAIEAFRKTTSGGTVTLVSREPDLPYYRLNLTRYLAGEIPETDLPIHDANWFSDRNIDLRLGTDAAEIRLEEQNIRLRSDTTIPYDKLIVSMGAHPFTPPIPGAAREGVISVRTIRDARWILEFLQPGMRCVVIGGGLLGLETAGALAAQKANVTLLESYDWLMPRQLNQQAGEILKSHVEQLGVIVRNNVRVQELPGDERVAGVQLDDGETIPADMVVLATGIRPNSHLARRVGLVVNKGIVVDNQLTSSHPRVYATGDVAEHQGVLYGNWAASQFQGSIAGMNAAGATAHFGGIPRSNTLKVLGLDLLSIGQFEPEDGSFQVIEDRLESGYYRFVFRDEHLVGSVLVGDTSLSGTIKSNLEARTDFSDVLIEGLSAGALADKLRQPPGNNIEIEDAL
jgi:nitrite reductase (NADH) large subunit